MNILFYFLEIAVFLTSLSWLVILPGYFLLSKAGKLFSKIEILTISMALGVVLFCLILLIFGILKITSGAYLAISIFNLFNIYRKKISLVNHTFSNLFKLAEKNWVSIAVITITSIFSASLIFISGWKNTNGLAFTEYRDAFWHLGLMKELVRSVPPLHPGFAPQPLWNYHFFTHLFGAGFLLIPIFYDLDFYFRIFPFFLTLLYGLSLFILGRALTKSTLGGNLAVLFGILTGSFAYVLSLFIKYQGFVWHESSFWLAQPFSMVINPSFALSSSLLLIVIFLVLKVQKQHSFWLIVVCALLAGTLIAFKVYPGLLVLGALLLAGVWFYIKQKNADLLKIFLLSLIISLVLFIPISGRDAGKFLVFLPGWFLRSMVESPDRVQIMDWVLRENTYLADGNSFGILRYRFLELLIYLIGNLGVRVLGIITVIKIIKEIKKTTPAMFLMVVITLVGLVIPLFFVQDGSIANTVQFSYYSLEILSVLSVVWIVNFLADKKKLVKILVVSGLLILAVPTSIKTWSEGLVFVNPMLVDNNQLSAFKYFLEEETKPDDIILVPASSYYTNSLVVGTLSNRRLYYSDRLMAENTHKNFKEREQSTNKFYNSQDKGWNTSFLKNNQISYVYLDKDSVPNFEVKFYPLLKVYNIGRIEIYKVL